MRRFERAVRILQPGVRVLQLPLAFAQGRLGLLARGDVAHGRHHEGTLGSFQRTEADLDREYAAVAAPAEQVEPYAHRAYVGRRVVLLLVAGMRGPAALRHQQLDGLAEQLAT